MTLLVGAKDDEDLRRIVLDEIQGMEEVVSSRTLLVFEEPPLESGGHQPSDSAQLRLS